MDTYESPGRAALRNPAVQIPASLSTVWHPSVDVDLAIASDAVLASTESVAKGSAAR